MKNALIQQAKPYYNHFMIAAIDDETLDKTMMAQVSQALLLIKGCVASLPCKGKDKSECRCDKCS